MGGIFIRGLGKDAQEEDVADSFGCFGDILSLQMPLDRMTGFVKGYCMLEYRERAEAKDAIRTMNGQRLRSWTLDVSWLCQEGPDTSPSAIGEKDIGNQRPSDGDPAPNRRARSRS